MTPRNWPKRFIYSPTSVPADIHPGLFAHLVASPDPKDRDRRSWCIEEQKIHPHLKIKKLKAPHPLCSPHPLVKQPDQYGLFATKKIPAETELGEYVGEIKIGLSDTLLSDSVYTWQLILNGHIFNLDSEKVANELTFVNDYRGIKEAPNVRTTWIVHLGTYFFGYETIRTIEPGEELLIDYGQIWEKKYELSQMKKEI